MSTRCGAVRACLVALLALILYLLVNKVRKDDRRLEPREFDAYSLFFICAKDNTTSVSVHGLFVYLRALNRFQKEECLEKDTLLPEETEEASPEEDPSALDSAFTETSKEPKSKPINEKKPKEETKPDESSPVIYQIIGLLLIVSVTYSLVECTKEKWARSKQGNNSGPSSNRKSLTSRQESFAASRRMSLADLTISRHERRENQASYRPPAAGKQRTKIMEKTEFHAR